MVEVSRARPASVAHASVVGLPAATGEARVVVGAEEGLEPGLLGGPRDRQDLVVGQPLLGLGHQGVTHALSLDRWRRMRATRGDYQRVEGGP